MTRTWIILLPVIVAILPRHEGFGQKIVVQNPFFQTSGQSMWGPSSAPGLNKNFVIFPEYSFNQPFNTGSFTKLSFAGLDFGAVLEGYVAFGLGPFQFDISGFTLGEIAVNYPAMVRLEMPDDSTFNPGETIVIRSSFQAAPGAELLTTYPQAGKIGLYMDVMFDARLSVQPCFIDCAPKLYILPPIDPNLFPSPLVDQRFTFFEVSLDGVVYICDNTSNPVDFLTRPFQCDFNTGFPPWTVSAGAFLGTLDIPNVTTTSMVVNNRNLAASGSDPYLTAGLDVIQLLGYIPPVKAVTSIIQGSQTLLEVPDITGTTRRITVDWAILRVLLNVPIAQSQDFQFEPRVFTELTFPDTVDYVVHSIRSGDIPGRGTTINYEVGDSISLKFPCTYDYMDVYAKHSIRNKIRNKTFDNISLNLDFDAIDFGLTVDPYTLVPEVCIPIPFSSDLCIGPIGFPGVSIDPPPLFDPAPITLISKDFPPYFQDEWEMGGFNEVTIPQPFRLRPRERQVNFAVVDAACSGDSTGSITTTVVGGSSPLKYEWSFGSKAANPVNVPAGKHYVKLTDVNDCVSFESVAVAQPPPLKVTVKNDSILCNGDVINITASASGGTGVLSYIWNTGETTAGITDKAGGKYTVTVTDEKGCSNPGSVQVGEPIALKARIINPVDPSCTQNRDGSMELLVEGGAAPYTYTWSGPSFSSLQRDIDEIGSGNYTVTVRDAHGCEALDSRVLTAPTVLAGSLSKLSDVLCFGDADGQLRANISGGTPPYEYKWYDSLITYSEDKSVITGLQSGEYWVEIRDAQNCRIVLSGLIDEPIQPLQADLSAMHPSCNDLAAGSLDLTVLGGTPPYQYLWSSGQTSEDISGLRPGPYEVKVTDAAGCSVRNVALVVEPDPIQASILVHDVSCADQKDGQIEVLRITGGTEPYLINWSTGDAGSMIQNLDEGTYGVTITDANDCAFTSSRSVGKTEGDCLFIPNTFSPNGDGVNDTWNIRNVYLYPGTRVTVYNRWGEVVFDSNGYTQPWDGSLNGQPLESSTFYYMVNLNNGTPVYTGFLMIVR